MEPSRRTRELQSATCRVCHFHVHAEIAFHRTFITREGQISRTQLQGLRPCLPAHESNWHRLDCMLFRYHPCFALPVEKPILPDEIVYWPCENGIIVTSPSGIILVLIRVPGKQWPVAWFEYPDRPDAEVFLFESDIVDKMPIDERVQNFTLEAISAGGGRVTIDWKPVVKMGRTCLEQDGTEMFRSRMVGMGSTEGSIDSPDAIFNFKYMTSKLINIRIPQDGIVDYRDISCSSLVLDRVPVCGWRKSYFRNSSSSYKRNRHSNRCLLWRGRDGFQDTGG